MNKTEIMAMEAGREIDALVHVHVMGLKCYHLNRRPVNPRTIRHANGAKDICEDCGWRTYVSDFRRAQPHYSRDVMASRSVINKLAYTEGGAWASFLRVFDDLLRNTGLGDTGLATAAIILSTMNPLFVCQAALVSKLKKDTLVDRSVPK